MRSRTLFTLILKIVGIIALWKAIQSFGAMLSGFGILASVFGHHMHANGTFMLALAFSMITGFVLSLVVAFYCLIRTDLVLQKLKLEGIQDLALHLDTKHVYHLVVVVFAVLAVLNGLAGFVSISYTTDTKTEITQNFSGEVKDGKSPDNGSKTTTETVSKDKKVNYFALIELVLGLLLLAKSKEAAQWLLAKVPVGRQAHAED